MQPKNSSGAAPKARPSDRAREPTYNLPEILREVSGATSAGASPTGCRLAAWFPGLGRTLLGGTVRRSLGGAALFRPTLSVSFAVERPSK